MENVENGGLLHLTLKSPYLIFIGGALETLEIKTGSGLVQWCPEKVAGQLRFKGCRLDLGVPDLTISEAIQQGVKSLVIGVAPIGGQINESWVATLVEGARAGLDIVSGLHRRLEEFEALVVAAKESGANLVNVRAPAKSLPVGTGEKRSGRRLLTVGTDCAIGKKYSALAITQAMRQRGASADFRATGQTGIMIAGSGIPIDAVIADFIAGAAESLSPANAPDHWDIIEGQGSLFNPAYAGVSLGLLHGSQPDAIVVCHDPSRKYIDNVPHLSLPSLSDCIELHLSCARLTNSDVRCVGVCINTSGLVRGDKEKYLGELSNQLGLPCVDPIADGCDVIVDNLVLQFGINA